MDHSFVRVDHISAGRFFENAAFALLVVLSVLFAFEMTRPLVSGGPLALSNVESVAVMVITLWLLGQIVRREPVRWPRELMLPAAAWLGVLIISTLFAPAHHDKALLFLGRVLAGILIMVAAYNLANTQARQRVLIGALGSSAILIALLGMMEAFNVSPVVSWLAAFKVAPTRVGDILRVSSTLSYATIAAMVLEMLLPLLLALFLIVRRVGWRLVLGGGIALVLNAHALTLSRAGALSIFVALALMAAAGIFRGWRRITTAAALSAVLYLLLLILLFVRNPNTLLRLATETEQSWYQAAYEVPHDIKAKPGERLTVPVKVTNNGQRSWNPDGEQFFALSYHLFDDPGDLVSYEGERTALPHTIEPGEEVELQGSILAPAVPGVYSIEWDMVQNTVTWFSWKNESAGSSALVVGGSALAGPDPPPPVTEAPTDITVISPTPGRIHLWQTALRMFSDYLVLGVGPDNFRWQYGSYAGVDEWNTGIHANNLYIELLADTGILGFGIFIWLSWRILRMGRAKVKGQRMEGSWLLVLGILVGLITWYLHGFFDYFYEFTPTYMLFWLMVGLLAAFIVPERESNADRI